MAGWLISRTSNPDPQAEVRYDRAAWIAQQHAYRRAVWAWLPYCLPRWWVWADKVPASALEPTWQWHSRPRHAAGPVRSETLPHHLVAACRAVEKTWVQRRAA